MLRYLMMTLNGLYTNNYLQNQKDGPQRVGLHAPCMLCRQGPCSIKIKIFKILVLLETGEIF